MHEDLHVRRLVHDVRQTGGVLLVEHARHELRVVDQVRQLRLDVAVVHVDRDGTHLEGAEHRRDPLLGVHGVDPDVVAGLHALLGQPVADAVGALVQLGEGEGAVAVDQAEPVGDGVDGVLEEVSDVVGHGEKLGHRAGS